MSGADPGFCNREGGIGFKAKSENDCERAQTNLALCSHFLHLA